MCAAQEDLCSLWDTEQSEEMPSSTLWLLISVQPKIWRNHIRGCSETQGLGDVLFCEGHRTFANKCFANLTELELKNPLINFQSFSMPSWKATLWALSGQLLKNELWLRFQELRNSPGRRNSWTVLQNWSVSSRLNEHKGREGHMKESCCLLGFVSFFF